MDFKLFKEIDEQIKKQTQVNEAFDKIEELTEAEEQKKPTIGLTEARGRGDEMAWQSDMRRNAGGGGGRTYRSGNRPAPAKVSGPQQGDEVTVTAANGREDTFMVAATGSGHVTLKHPRFDIELPFIQNEAIRMTEGGWYYEMPQK